MNCFQGKIGLCTILLNDNDQFVWSTNYLLSYKFNTHFVKGMEHMYTILLNMAVMC